MNEKRLIQVTMLPAASVVIAEDDYRELERLHQENEQLRGNLSLAEEGLANYEEEVQAWIKIQAQKDTQIERLRAGLQKYGFHASKCSAGFPLSDHCTCGFSDALRSAEPQTAPHAAEQDAK